MGELLKMSLAETDPAKRHEMHCEMQTLVHNDAGMVIPYHTNVLDAKSTKVHGFSNVPLGQLGGNGWAEFFGKTRKRASEVCLEGAARNFFRAAPLFIVTITTSRLLAPSYDLARATCSVVY
ncbi:MAG: hypothetical protein CM1200mP41_18940 [Gammaproteobacteria bacterium]|nr:MAG: hypothetical protein CM1200mP41_18940 [Gammaproteobacteria bacterium]